MNLFVLSCLLVSPFLLSIASSQANDECGSTQGITKLQCFGRIASRAKSTCLVFHEAPSWEWKAHLDRYLFMGCQYGRVSGSDRKMISFPLYCLPQHLSNPLNIRPPFIQVLIDKSIGRHVVQFVSSFSEGLGPRSRTEPTAYNSVIIWRECSIEHSSFLKIPFLTGGRLTGTFSLTTNTRGSVMDHTQS